MRRFIKATVLSATVALVCAPTMARADGYVNPWAGVNFGSDIANGRGGFGVGAGWMGAGIAGGEVNFGYSPSFFGTQDDFGNNTVIDLMANVIVGVPIGGQHGHGFRPYVTGGLGLIRTQIDGGTVFDVQTSDNDFGWNLGAGAMGYFNDHVGVRGDVRYLRNINGDIAESLNFSNGGFHFWRTSIGLVIR
jgi:opacity protein-like surface antigen